MTGKQIFFCELFSIIVFCAFVSCNDDSLGEDRIGEVKKTVENLAKEVKELKELENNQLKAQLETASMLDAQGTKHDKMLQNILGEEQKDNAGVYEMLAVLKKSKKEPTDQDKAIVQDNAVVESKVRSKIEELKIKRDILLNELFSVSYIGFLWYIKIEPNSTITPDQDLAAKTALKETLVKQLECIHKDPIFLRSAEAYFVRNSSLTDLAELARLKYTYKSGSKLATPCLGLPAGSISDTEYKNALDLFESRKSAIMCYLNILSLTIAQANLENSLNGLGK